MVRPVQAGPQPEVPVQRLGNLMLLLQSGQPIDLGGVDRGAARVDRVHLADRAVPDPLAERADRVGGMPWLPNWVTTSRSLAAFISPRTS
jgi:hypothetical protein